MKTAEDEAFEDIERRQGGGFKAKKAMAADKFKDGIEWWMDTTTYGAYPNPPQWHIDTGKLVRLVPAQPAQEPVAEVVWGAKTDFEWKFKMLVELACVEDVPVKLYAGEFKGASVYWHDTETDKGTTPPLSAQPAQEPADKLYHSTEARWCENFVEVKHPHIENEIVRFYFTQPAHKQVAVDATTMELAESVGLIGPASRTHDLHAAIQRFHDLICANATLKAAKMAADAISEIAPTQPTQEPVAWMVYTLDGKSVCVTDNPTDFTDEHRALPLYTTPPKREWVGLTNVEIAVVLTGDASLALNLEDLSPSWIELVQAVEAKLKEKNT